MVLHPRSLKKAGGQRSVNARVAVAKSYPYGALSYERVVFACVLGLPVWPSGKALGW